MHNESYYNDRGRFLDEVAKEAMIELMNYHGFPVFPETKEKLWVSDFGTGRFTEVGAGCVCYINNTADNYMLMDLFILPNQMLPEHQHLDTSTLSAKMEGWLIRHGKSYVVAEGEDNLEQFEEVKIPSVHMQAQSYAKHVTPAVPGMFVPLAKTYGKHWQFAGPEGAIMTEVATADDPLASRYSDEMINDFFLKMHAVDAGNHH